jgi:VCBS repeat-containing protein
MVAAATSLLATATGATILQRIADPASVQRQQSAFVKRISSSGPIKMTMDGGTTWTKVAVGDNWTRVSIPAQNWLVQPLGFVSRPKIAVDGRQEHHNRIPSMTRTVVPDRAGVNVGASVTGDVLANDTDPITGDTLKVVAVNSLATNVDHTIAGMFGSLTLDDNGSYTYTASKHATLPASGVGEDVFTYTASTGHGGEATSTLTVVVTTAGLTYVVGIPYVPVTAPSGHTPVLDGGGGNDILIASNGAAVFIGGPGDKLTGGTSTDTYMFTGHFGNNTITNYNPAKDIIQLDQSEFLSLGGVKAAAAQQIGTNNTVITYDAGDTITLIGVLPSQLHFDASHFVLA